MINWKNMDTLAAYAELKAAKPVNVKEAMSGENGAARVKAYTAPMGGKMDFNYGARPVDGAVLEALAAFAKEQQMTEKFAALYNGEKGKGGKKRRGRSKYLLSVDVMVGKGQGKIPARIVCVRNKKNKKDWIKKQITWK